jgi:hypothetical protein
LENDKTGVMQFGFTPVFYNLALEEIPNDTQIKEIWED